jgi:Uma2 family endonuclease
MAIQVQKRLFTVEEYHKMAEVGILPERGVELINGEIFEMSPIGSKHAKIVKKLNSLLNKLLGNRFIISVQDPIIANDLSEPEPDLAVLDYQSDFYESGPPLADAVQLVIEVADKTLDYDLSIKLPLYARNVIPEYWIIDLTKKEIQTFWKPEVNIYKFREVLNETDTICAKNFSLEIPITEIFN